MQAYKIMLPLFHRFFCYFYSNPIKYLYFDGLNYVSRCIGHLADFQEMKYKYTIVPRNKESMEVGRQFNKS